AGMNVQRAFVVHGVNGWDEPTPVAPFVLFDVRPGAVSREERCASDYGLRTCGADALAGGDAAQNAAALRDVLEGRVRDAHRDCLVMGAALALELTGHAHDAREGVAQAEQAIASGRAAALLKTLATFQADRGAA